MSIACQKDFTITVNASITAPTAYWKMEEASGTRFDAIGVAANNFILSAGVDLGDAGGLIGNSIAYLGGGLTAYFTTLGSTLQYVAGTGMTMAFWVKFNGPISASTQKFHFELSANFLDFLVSVDSATVVFDFAPSAGPDAIATLPFPFTAGPWFFIVAKYDPATQKTSVSVNNGAFTSSAVTASDVGVSVPAAAELANIGGPNVFIDEMGIWLGHILSASEISYLYNSGAGQRPI